MNTHLKRGIIVGIIVVIFLSAFSVIADRNRSVPFWDSVRDIICILISPITSIWEFLGFTGCKGLGAVFWIFGSFLLYFFITGSCLGASISYLTNRIHHKRKNQSPQGLNNGSPR